MSTSTTVSSSSSSLSLLTMDELCNKFLLKKQSDRITLFNLQPIIQPLLPPSSQSSQSALSLSKIDNIHKLQLLVYNRSWNDVIVLIESLLYGTITSHLAPIYTMLACSIQQQQQQQQQSTNTNSTCTDNNNTINYLILDDTLALDSHKIELLWVMTIHVQALLKLKLYTKLSTLLNTWTFCYHHKQYTKQYSPKWISLSFHIFTISCLTYTSTSTTTTTTTNSQSSFSETNPAIDMLWKIRSELLDNNNNNNNNNTSLHSSSIVERSAAIIQIELTLANIFITNKCWRMVLECYERIMSNDTSTVSVIDTSCNDNTTNNDTQEQKGHVLDILCNEELSRYHPNELSKINCDTVRTVCHIELLSRQGQILLQIGAIEQGYEIYNQAVELWETICTGTCASDVKTSKIFAIQVVPIQLDINQGLLSFSQGKHTIAYKHFTNAIQTIRTIQQNESFYIKDFDPTIKNIDCTNTTTTITPLLLLLMNQSMKRNYINTIYCEINNNISLCQLYTCQLHNSITTIESIICENPIIYLTDRIIMNLCTLYELGYDTNESNNKKKLIQYITIQRFNIHDILSECFRIV